MSKSMMAIPTNSFSEVLQFLHFVGVNVTSVDRRYGVDQTLLSIEGAAIPDVPQVICTKTTAVQGDTITVTAKFEEWDINSRPRLKITRADNEAA